MMVHIPGRTDDGIITEALTEFVDLFPTLVDAANLPSLELCPEDSDKTTLCREGSSLMPLIDNPKLPSWKNRSFSQYPREGSHMGYTMRTDKLLYPKLLSAVMYELCVLFYLGIATLNGCCSNMLLSINQTGTVLMLQNFMITTLIRSEYTHLSSPLTLPYL